MKQLNLRQKYYSIVIRLGLILAALVGLLIFVPKIPDIKSFRVSRDLNGADIAQIVIALFIAGILLYFTYVTETQLPKIKSNLKALSLILSSTVHIAVIFIAYNNLPISLQKNQTYYGIFIFLLCVPLFRAGRAYIEWTKKFADDLASSVQQENVKCTNCGTLSNMGIKYCAECGYALPQIEIQN